MKKIILSIVLALVMLLSFGMVACTPEENELGAEISFTVADDSKVAEPTYSKAFKTSIVDTFMLFFDEDDVDVDELQAVIEENILPLCSKAKISEANLKAIVNYFKNNKNKINELIDTMSEDEPPKNMKAFVTSYFAIIKGAFDVLNADDVGKLMFVVLQDKDTPWYDTDTAAIVKDIGRDNFIIVSRFMFKIMGVSLQKREPMIDVLVGMMESLVLGEGDIGDITEKEIFELYIMLIEMEYSVYETVTDSEINKLIEIYVDVYAAVSKRIDNKTISSTKKAELVATYQELVADYRAGIKLMYKTVLRVDYKIFDKDDGYFDLFDTLIEAYEKDLTAAEKTRITNLIKAVFTDAQYYKGTRTEVDRWSYYSYYDYETEEYVRIYTVEYRTEYVKSTVKQFDSPAKLLNDPIAALKIMKNGAMKRETNKEYELTQEEREIYDFFDEHSVEFTFALSEKIGLPTEEMKDSLSKYEYEEEEVRTSGEDWWY